jgi:hypothetical protein
MNPKEQSESRIEPLELSTDPVIEDETPRRLLSLWPGKQSFLIDGKIILGPSSDSWMPSLFLNLLGVLSVIFYFDVLPYNDSSDTLMLSAGFTLCLVAMLIFYFATLLIEPGLIPPEAFIQNPNYFSEVDSANIGLLKAISKFAQEKWGTEKLPPKNSLNRDSNLSFDSLDQHPNFIIGHNPNDMSNMSNLSEINAKLDDRKETIDGDSDCTTCKVTKLPDSGHCATCDSCVRFFMGHSRLMNKCIGKRNYRAYFIFITFGLLFVAYFALSSFARLNQDKALEQLAKIGLIVISLFELCFLGLILCFCLLYFLMRHKRAMKAQLHTVGPDSESPDVFWTSPSLVIFSKVVPPAIEST